MNSGWARGLASTAIFALLTGFIAAAAFAWDRSRSAGGWTEGGPALPPNAHGYVVRYQAGDVFSDGLERVKLAGNQPGVLDHVEISEPSADRFKVIGVRVAGPHRSIGSWQVGDGFPPVIKGYGPDPLGKLVPAHGASLPTGITGSVLVIGLKVVKPGLGIRTGVRIYYTVAGEKYTTLFRAAIANCPATMSTRACQNAYLKLQSLPQT